MYKSFFKPILDVAAAAVVFVLLLPLFLVVAALLTIALKGTPFFTQTRPGKDERLFSIIKFRTMSNEKDAQGNLLPDAQRLSGFGKFVRSTSLDELPQLLNVIKGDMSFVGPRPLLPQYLPLYSEEQKKRHFVKPGITGWAQVNGRNALSWQKKFELDVYYVEKISFALDMKIIALTVQKVVNRTDINSTNSVTTEPFRGNQL
ncbi:sugar transferase [Marinirhabdus gelatinilytica]|uniref:Lipopolysaccharide/colanic/teichoic acid biosynthesis glycosyltransferase n=1 Tax=Marinirhabdus gelatinilytica TaxID=1703343 RepID=A0A370QG46_9FLAO|nr:sugar transferase [Marinirhabdus gelatinilytica]RDK87334.1 lipopolysaccharide/colanic/teichoic acid biosynthesis glycosyltransferase [Marinirhabdus gelatinilytica]